MDRYAPAVSLGEVSAEDAVEAIVQYTSGAQPPAHGLQLRAAGRRVLDRAHPRGRRARSRRAARTAGRAGRSATTTSRASPRAGPTARASAARAKLFNALLLSLRGTACSYQGEELGLTQAELPDALLQDPYGLAFWPLFKGRDGCRTPMPWNDREPDVRLHQRPAVAAGPAPNTARSPCNRQDAAPDSVLNAYRGFVRWRRGVPALHNGGIRLFDSPGRHARLPARARGRVGPRLLQFRLGAERDPHPAARKTRAAVGHGFAACIPGRGVVTVPAHGAFFANTPKRGGGTGMKVLTALDWAMVAAYFSLVFVVAMAVSGKKRDARDPPRAISSATATSAGSSSARRCSPPTSAPSTSSGSRAPAPRAASPSGSSRSSRR